MQSAKLPSSSVGAWTTVSHPLVAEAMLSQGVYDWLTIDDEHCAFTEPEIMQILQVCERLNVIGLVRLRTSDPIQARKMLDFGASGILLPMVESADQVQNIIDNIYYAPKGRRGVCLARINRWGDDFETYMRDYKPILIAQIESQKGVDNIESIAKLPELTGVFLGPYDLSASLGAAGNFTTPEFKKVAERVKTVTLQAKKALGIHVVKPSPEELKSRQAEGYNFIAYGTDLICLRHSLESLKSNRK